LLVGAAPGDLGAVLTCYQRLRRARTRKIQHSSRATNDLLHLPDGPALADRDLRMSRFPEDFGWIHAFDALDTARRAGQPVRVAEPAL
jgi:salicylate hydroxylase